MKSNQQRIGVMQPQDLVLWAQTQKENGILGGKEKKRKEKTALNLT